MDQFTFALADFLIDTIYSISFVITPGGQSAWQT